MKELNLILIHNGKEWVAKNGEIVVKGRTLDELDKNIRGVLKGKFKKGEKIEVKMEYDYRTFPFWMIQYHQYFLRRIIYVDL